MNDEPLVDEQDAARWLNRLADGELNEHSRHMLFEWLDGDPARWRFCALVLLETHELQATFGDWVGTATSPAICRPQASAAELVSCSSSVAAPSRRTSARSRWGSLSSVGAAVVVAFGLGMGADRLWNRESQLADGTDQRKVSLRAADDVPKSVEPNPIPGQAASAEDRHSEPSRDRQGASILPVQMAGLETASLPDYVRSQFERYGYRVDSEQKVISVTLSDGRQMAIPVEEWKFQYAGFRAY